eukprot:2032541-Pleurochrysis_carterae.AAC.2
MARSNAGSKSTQDTCVTRIGFVSSASPSACEPWIQYVLINAIARQPAADASWSLATAMNIRWKAREGGGVAQGMATTG